MPEVTIQSARAFTADELAGFDGADSDRPILLALMGIVFDVMVMPTLFFVSGYLTVASLKRKTAGKFILGKIRRLVIPWVIAVFTLIPAYKGIFLYSRGLPQEHWSTYFHITSANSQNWLWFLPILFLFNLAYLGLSKVSLPTDRLSLAWSVALVFAIAITSTPAAMSVFTQLGQTAVTRMPSFHPSFRIDWQSAIRANLLAV